MEDFIIRDKYFPSFMEDTVEPYLARRRSEFRIPRGADGTLFCVRYDADGAVGTAVLSHGFTETAEKYLEIIYYFVRHGYNVVQPEHCGHGRSYRLVKDLSLVHIDSYDRYVRDLLAAAGAAKNAYPDLPLYLYGHSMGGGIAAAALAAQPDLFQRAILSSPMIQPLTNPFPWAAAKLLAHIFCGMGRAQQYVPGGHAFDGNEPFESSASINRERFEYYQNKRNAEPLFQMTAASCGWVREAARLNRYLMHEGYRNIETPTLLFQSHDDAFVSNEAQKRFVEKVRSAGKTAIDIAHIDGTRHEIFNSGEQILQAYWKQVFQFLSGDDA